MLNVDVADRLGKIFALGFPYEEVEPKWPCGKLIRAHPAFATGLGPCAARERFGKGRPTVRFHEFDSCDACAPRRAARYSGRASGGGGPFLDAR